MSHIVSIQNCVFVLIGSRRSPTIGSRFMLVQRMKRIALLVVVVLSTVALATPPICDGPIGGCDFSVSPCDGEACGGPSYQLEIECPHGEGTWSAISHMEAVEWCQM